MGVDEVGAVSVTLPLNEKVVGAGAGACAPGADGFAGFPPPLPPHATSKQNIDVVNN